MTVRLTLLLLLGGATPVVVDAQDSVRLRFAPVEGSRIHRVFQAHTRLAVEGEAHQTRELAHLGGMSQVATIGVRGEPVVHLVFDSLRTRVREGTAAWREHRPAKPNGLWLQVRLDPQLRERGLAGPAGRAGAEFLLELATGYRGLTLPDHWLREADGWAVQSPVRAALGDGTSAGAAELAVEGFVTVDSVVRRSSDTLAYLSVAGVIAPRVLRAADGTLQRFSGEARGALVWSTAWRTFVSVATRTRITVDLEGASRTTRPGRVVLETTVRTSVRPRS